MSDSFEYSTTFKLDKEHFRECFSNSVVKRPFFVTYQKAIALFVFGLGVVMFTEVNAYIGYFIVGLGFVEALGCYFAKPWWVARQVIGRSGNSEVTLSIDNEGIYTHSSHVNSTILHSDISEVSETADGLLITHSKGKSYISAKCLSNEAKAYLLAI